MLLYRYQFFLNLETQVTTLVQFKNQIVFRQILSVSEDYIKVECFVKGIENARADIKLNNKILGALLRNSKKAEYNKIGTARIELNACIFIIQNSQAIYVLETWLAYHPEFQQGV